MSDPRPMDDPKFLRSELEKFREQLAGYGSKVSWMTVILSERRMYDTVINEVVEELRAQKNYALSDKLRTARTAIMAVDWESPLHVKEPASES